MIATRLLHDVPHRASDSDRRLPGEDQEIRHPAGCELQAQRSGLITAIGCTTSTLTRFMIHLASANKNSNNAEDILLKAFPDF